MTAPALHHPDRTNPNPSTAHDWTCPTRGAAPGYRCRDLRCSVPVHPLARGRVHTARRAVAIAETARILDSCRPVTP